MLVLKFGGTSVGSAERMNEVLSIIKSQSADQKLVVLSAMSGTTNALVTIAEHMYAGHREDAKSALSSLIDTYDQVKFDLFQDEEYQKKAGNILQREFKIIADCLGAAFSKIEEKIIVAQGEVISTNLFHLLCQSLGVNSALLPALDFMRIDEKSEPFLERTAALLRPMLSEHHGVDILITQGYICRNHWEEVDNLQRGGSDYTATILGAVVQSDEIQIWTDIDGIHNNDPRLVDDTMPLRQLSYREAAELAYFGAKILHPTCVLPAEKMQVPLRLKYTMKPDAPGTLISNQTSQRPITAIAAKDGITAINIYSHRMLMAYGFMKKVFQVFEDHKTPIDMITTSEVAVSLTIDDNTRLDRIIEDVGQFAEVQATEGFSIICIVGNDLFNKTEYIERIFKSLRDTPVRMVSMGGSKYNISLLVKTDYKKEALKALNAVFKDQVQAV